MLLDEIRFIRVGEQKIIDCNIPQKSLLDLLDKWIKKENTSKLNPGIFGSLNIRRSTFKIHFRFSPNPIIGAENFYYLHYYIKGKIIKVHEAGCLIEYGMVYDRAARILYKMIGLGCFYIAAIIVKNLLIPFGISDGFDFFLLSLAIMFVFLGVRGLSRKQENKEKAEQAMIILEDYLKPYINQSC